MRSVFFPFPNESSFCLGHWYWTRGVQNSLQSFKDLIGIVGHTDFNPNNIRQTKWDKINQKLGDNVEEGQEGEWVDDDAGWKQPWLRYKYLFTNACKVQACMSTWQQTSTTAPLLVWSKSISLILIWHHSFTWSPTNFCGSQEKIVQRLDFTVKYTLLTLFLRNTRLCKFSQRAWVQSSMCNHWVYDLLRPDTSHCFQR